MPRKPILSPTRLSTYLACPVKYRWTFVDPRGRVFQRAKWYYSFGTSLHRTLEELYRRDLTGVPVKEAVAETLEENWIAAGFHSPEEAEEALAEGRGILTSFVEAEVRRQEGAQVLDVERRIQKDMGAYILLGVVDRINRRPDGSIEVVDYKSLRSETSEEDVRNDLAMMCYQVLVRSLFDAPRYYSTIVSLRTNHSATVEILQEEVERFVEDLNALASEILHREFHEIEPRWKDLCEDCDFLSLCRKHPEFHPASG
jgi:RecB family exonuclease